MFYLEFHILPRSSTEKFYEMTREMPARNLSTHTHMRTHAPYIYIYIYI